MNILASIGDDEVIHSKTTDLFIEATVETKSKLLSRLSAEFYIEF